MPNREWYVLRLDWSQRWDLHWLWPCPVRFPFQLVKGHAKADEDAVLEDQLLRPGAGAPAGPRIWKRCCALPQGRGLWATSCGYCPAALESTSIRRPSSYCPRQHRSSHALWWLMLEAWSAQALGPETSAEINECSKGHGYSLGSSTSCVKCCHPKETWTAAQEGCVWPGLKSTRSWPRRAKGLYYSR